MSETESAIADGLQIYSKIKTILSLIGVSIIFLCIFTVFVRSLIYYDILGKNGRISYKKIINNRYVDCIEKNLTGCTYYTEYKDNNNKDHINKYMDDLIPASSSEYIDPKTIAINKNIYYSNVNTNNFSFVNRSINAMGPFIGSSIVLIILIAISIQLYLITTYKNYGVATGIYSIVGSNRGYGYNNGYDRGYNRGIQLRF
jgi:hypothetical protein